MRVDHHVHIGKDFFRNYELKESELTNQMHEFKIDKAIIFSCPNPTPLENKIKINPYEKANKDILEISKQNKQLIPFMFVHPFYEQTEIIKKNEKEFQGFKFLTRALGLEYSYDENFNSQQQVKYVMDRGKPVIFHIGKKEDERASNLISLISKYPKTPLVIAHAGRLIHEDLKLIAKYRNVFLEISPLRALLEKKDLLLPPLNMIHNSISEDLRIEKVVDYLISLFENRIIWGTDSPWCDNLSKLGYSGEVDVFNYLKSKKINTSILNVVL